MEKESLSVLQKSSLCRGMTELEIQQLLADNHSEVTVHEKGERIFDEMDCPGKIFILLSGRVMIAKDTLAGRRMILTRIENAGEMFGEVYAFLGREAYDMYAEVLCHTQVLSMSNSIFSEDISEKNIVVQKLRNNLLSVFAAKAYHMNAKLRVLGGATLREKIVRFLFERQNRAGEIIVPMSREEMADYLNVTRPSLSRELGNLQKEGILFLKGRSIRVVNQEIFESFL